jgi:hypothetical protein
MMAEIALKHIKKMSWWLDSRQIDGELHDRVNVVRR